MSPNWVVPCYVPLSRKFSPGLKILLAAARQERVWGGIFQVAKVSRFRSGQESQILTKTVSPPLAPRHRQQQNVRPYDAMKTWYVVSFHSCSLWHWLKNIIIFFFRTHSTFSLPCKTLRQYVSHMSPVKRICVFEHSVMTNFNCACPAIQRGQGSGFLSEGSSWLNACMSEQRRFWRDCADAQARLNLRCSHRR